MTKTEFIRIKTKGFTPAFKELIGLQTSDKTKLLIEFMNMLHPNAAQDAEGSRGNVYGKKHYAFTIYNTGILKTVVETGKRTFYPL